jgi:uncharacterized protein (DUF2141 family)
MTPTFRLYILVLVLSLTAPALAQNSPASQKDGMITGSVVDSVSGQPIAGAQVFARGMPMPGGGAPGQPASTTTDVNGEFKLDNLAAGRYMVRSMHAGYVARGNRGSEGAMRNLILSSGQRVSGVVLSLVPGGAVSGHITDEGGKAIAGAAVVLMKSSYNAGKKESNESATTTTEESGEFRFTGLAPGRYYLRASSPPAKRSKAASDQAYVPLYYPHATDQASAAPLEVQPGGELGGIDLSFAPVHTVRIAGQVVDMRTSLPAKSASVTLLSDRGNTAFPSGETTTDGKGSFEFRGIPQGSYVIAAQSSEAKDQEKTIWGKSSADVFDADVTNVKVTISPGADVAGRIRVEGKAASQMERLSVSLEPRDGPAVVELMPEVENASVGTNGMYVFRNVPEGTYDINVEPVPAGYYLKATNGSDTLDSVNVGRGHGSAVPDITLSPASAWVSGSVSNGNQATSGISVVLVPTGKRQAQPQYYKTAMTDRLGRFTLRTVAPGDYKLYAWEEVERDAYMDPDFLRDYEDRGQSVHVEDSPVTGLQVDMIPASDMTR